MGYYLNKDINGKPLKALNKVQDLISSGASLAPKPISFQPDLVCVVNNVAFEAAAWAYSEEEMQQFLFPDGRAKTWLIVPGAEGLVD